MIGKCNKVLSVLLMGLALVVGANVVLAKEVPVTDTDIQAAIDSSDEGDVLVLGEGTYTGNIIINKALTIKGAGKDSTIISGQVNVSSDATIQDLTISNKGANAGGIELDSTVNLNVSNVVIQYDGYDEVKGDYGNSDYFTGIWLTKKANGSTLVVDSSDIYAKYGVWVYGEKNNVTISNSNITGWATVDISNGTNPGTTASNNTVTIENSTLTGVAFSTAEYDGYGTIVIGGQDGLELNISNSTVTNKFIKENVLDLISFGDAYLPSKNVVINIENSKLINTDTTENSSVINFSTEDNTLGGSIVNIDSDSTIESANGKTIEIVGDDTVLLTLSSPDGDTTIAVPKGTVVTEDMLAIDEISGYTFEGWYTDSEYTTKFVADTEINDDTVIYAKFTKITQTSEEDEVEEVSNAKTGDINLVTMISIIVVAIIGLAITCKKLVTR